MELTVGAHCEDAGARGTSWQVIEEGAANMLEFFISPCTTYFIRACSQKTRRWDAVLSAARASGSWEAQLAPFQTRLFKLFPEGGRVLLGSVAWRHLAYSRRHGGNWRIIPRRRR